MNEIDAYHLRTRWMCSSITYPNFCGINSSIIVDIDALSLISRRSAGSSSNSEQDCVVSCKLQNSVSFSDKDVVENINEVIAERQIGAIPVIEDSNGRVICPCGIRTDTTWEYEQSPRSSALSFSSPAEPTWPRRDRSVVTCVHATWAGQCQGHADGQRAAGIQNTYRCVGSALSGSAARIKERADHCWTTDWPIHRCLEVIARWRLCTTTIAVLTAVAAVSRIDQVTHIHRATGWVSQRRCYRQANAQ